MLGQFGSKTRPRPSADSAISVTSASSTVDLGRPPPEMLAERLGQPIAEGAELEEVEQLVHLVGIDDGRSTRSSRCDVQVDVADEHHHLGVLAHLRLVPRPGWPRSFGVCSSTWAKMPSRPP